MTVRYGQVGGQKHLSATETMVSLPPDLTSLIGIYSQIDTAQSQDAVLHAIFDRVVHYHLENSPIVRDAAITLYKLYFTHDWESARTYFFLLTGVLIDDDERVVHALGEVLTRETLDPTSQFKDLWWSGADEDDDISDITDDSDYEDEEEDEDEDEEEDRDQTWEEDGEKGDGDAEK